MYRNDSSYSIVVIHSTQQFFMSVIMSNGDSIGLDTRFLKVPESQEFSSKFNEKKILHESFMDSI